ncbi:MAG: hypothetical protein HBSAPP03_10320 [Phycisphaerae bacterium]|nr:MAG: hypothetical protein HBSAPP03_10320 [Phycisphaerae bacterium]
MPDHAGSVEKRRGLRPDADRPAAARDWAGVRSLSLPRRLHDTETLTEYPSVSTVPCQMSDVLARMYDAADGPRY